MKTTTSFTAGRSSLALTLRPNTLRRLIMKEKMFFNELEFFYSSAGNDHPNVDTFIELLG